MAQLEVDVVATDRQVWTGTAALVSAPSVSGQIGILPGHTPLLAVLQAGTVKITTASEAHEFKIDGGFLSVDDNRVTIVADEATGG